MKERADILLVEKGFFDSREKAKRAIMAGNVIINNQKVDKPGTQIKIDEEPEIRIKGDVCPYVSRGGFKLKKAIDTFNLNFKDALVIDIGASTGGFTDCALQHGAKFVYAVDVGTNQLDWKLRNDERVKSLENTHVKDFSLKDTNEEKPDFIVMDVSFISITKVFEYLMPFFKEETKLMALIKPQFEVGKENIEKGGIVRDKSKHKMAIEQVVQEAKKQGLFLEELDFSPITGTTGNIEYISLFSKNKIAKEIDIDFVIDMSKKLGGKYEV
jgi:23S rRNA (cytidine1920-2'-O)/16S rRNA (cytidine1409-2'-O)-methyltransferase